MHMQLQITYHLEFLRKDLLKYAVQYVAQQFKNFIYLVMTMSKLAGISKLWKSLEIPDQ